MQLAAAARRAASSSARRAGYIGSGGSGAGAGGSVSAVLGSQWGDEGKGKVCAPPRALGSYVDCSVAAGGVRVPFSLARSLFSSPLLPSCPTCWRRGTTSLRVSTAAPTRGTRSSCRRRRARRRRNLPSTSCRAAFCTRARSTSSATAAWCTWAACWRSSSRWTPRALTGRVRFCSGGEEHMRVSVVAVVWSRLALAHPPHPPSLPRRRPPEALRPRDAAV